MKRYYWENLNAIPYSIWVDVFSDELPMLASKAFAVFFTWKSKLGFPMKPAHGFGPVGSSHLRSKSVLPPHALAQMAARMEQLADAEFQEVQFGVEDTIGPKETVAGLYLDPTGTCLLTLQYLRMPGADGFEEQTHLELNSICGDTTEVVTMVLSDQHHRFSELTQVEGVEQHCLSLSTPLSRAYEQHQACLQGRNPQVIQFEAAVDVSQAIAQRRFDKLRARGMILELTDQQIQRIQAKPLPKGW